MATSPWSNQACRGPGRLWARSLPRGRYRAAARGRARTPADQVLLELASDRLELPRRHAEGFLRAAGVDLGVDLAARAAQIGGRTVCLGARETAFALLVELARRPGEVLPRRILFERAWGRPARSEYDLAAVSKHVCQLRRALGEVGAAGALILTAPEGYRLRPGTSLAWIRPPKPRRREPESPRLLPEIRRLGLATPRALARATGLSRATVGRGLERLVRRGAVARLGAGRSTAYRLTMARPAAPSASLRRGPGQDP
jgi:DNA-binding winged helix-turn-helix (wHTH) protein